MILHVADVRLTISEIRHSAFRLPVVPGVDCETVGVLPIVCVTSLIGRNVVVPDPGEHHACNCYVVNGDTGMEHKFPKDSYNCITLLYKPVSIIIMKSIQRN